jgi:hypothetical protein
VCAGARLLAFFRRVEETTVGPIRLHTRRNPLISAANRGARGDTPGTLYHKNPGPKDNIFPIDPAKVYVL